MERTFFFLGFCLPSIQAVWLGFNADSVLRRLFFWGFDFRKTKTNLFLDFDRTEEGSGEESARAFGFFGEVGYQKRYLNFEKEKGPECFHWGLL